MKWGKEGAELATAIEQIVGVFGPLPRHALDTFAAKYGSFYGHTFPPEFASQEVVPALVKQQRIYSLPGNKVSWHPGKKPGADDRKNELAYWVFLEHMNASALTSLMRGPAPAVATYFKCGNLYHIIVCSGAGETELGLGAHLSEQTDQRRLGDSRSIQEKFLVVFTSNQYLDQAETQRISNALFAVVTLDSNGSPSIKFVKR